MTHNELRLRVVYDPLEGFFFDARTHEPILMYGRGGVKNNNYDGISIDGVQYYAHRLAVFYMTGEWPEHEVDHRDRDRRANRWSNIRSATHQENLRNRPTYSNNKSGLKWVTLHKASGLWRACMTVDKVHINLGYFKTPEVAYEMACAKARELHGEFARMN